MDALDRELSASLDVDPSPEFVARVRARIAMEPSPVHWLMPRVPRLLMTAGVALVVMVVAVAVEPRREPLSAPAVALVPSQPAPAQAVETEVAVAQPRRVHARHRPAEVQLVSISELPDAPGLSNVEGPVGAVVPAMRFEIVTMTGVHP